MTTHMKRLITAFIAIPFLIVIINYAPLWVFSTVILFVALISLHEFYRMMGIQGAEIIFFFSYLLTAAVFLTVLSHGTSSMVLFPLFVIFPLVFSLFVYPKNSRRMRDIGQVIMGPFYICLPLVFLAIISGIPQGRMWVFFILTVIFAGDTGAFYCGKLFGKHKLTQISPGKTWEGSAGGLVVNVACAVFFGYVFFPSLSLTSLMILGIAIGISGQFGDLAESMLKRMSHIKDSGTILPGHGGMLDRIDSLLFAIPILYLYISFQKMY